MLRSLASNSHVKEFAIDMGYLTHQTSNAATLLLDSNTSSIESLLLQLRARSGDQEILRPIALGLINNESVMDITFKVCHFSDSGCTRVFKSILQSKPNIRSLCVHYCFVADGVLSPEDFIHLLGPDSKLRSFELSVTKLQDYGFSSGVEFKGLLEAVETMVMGRMSIPLPVVTHRTRRIGLSANDDKTSCHGPSSGVTKILRIP